MHSYADTVCGTGSGILNLYTVYQYMQLPQCRKGPDEEPRALGGRFREHGPRIASCGRVHVDIAQAIKKNKGLLRRLS